MSERLSMFLAASPGLEATLAEEARALGLADVQTTAGGVLAAGAWGDVLRANLWSRIATRVLARIDAFRAPHLAQLDKRARRVDWGAFLRRDEPVAVEASSKRSRIYHTGAAAERVAGAIRETLGAPISDTATVRVLARLENDLCTLSVDASGEALHKRGHRLAVGKAPLRETLAAAFLAECGYRGGPLVDPMCGAGAFPIEASEIALGLAPGRSREFAVARLAGFDAAAWERMRAAAIAPGPVEAPFVFGYDRDPGAIEASLANAERAGVLGPAAFGVQPVSALEPPDPSLGPGLVMVNPPYGERIGAASRLPALYGALGGVLKERFRGWRVGLVTSEPRLARAAGLPFAPPGPPIPHGPLKIRLYQTAPLA